jgi:hypothetical protein
MGSINIFWYLAVASIIAAVWLFFSRSVIACIVTACALAGTLMCFVYMAFGIWFFRRPEGIIAGLAATDWQRMTFEFLLPLTVCIAVSSSALCVHWRRTCGGHNTS